MHAARAGAHSMAHDICRCSARCMKRKGNSVRSWVAEAGVMSEYELHGFEAQHSLTCFGGM